MNMGCTNLLKVSKCFILHKKGILYKMLSFNAQYSNILHQLYQNLSLGKEEEEENWLYL